MLLLRWCVNLEAYEVRLRAALRLLLPGGRTVSDDQLQRFVFSVASSVWAVGDADATVRTLRETFRQFQQEQQYRRDVRTGRLPPRTGTNVVATPMLLPD